MILTMWEKRVLAAARKWRAANERVAKFKTERYYSREENAAADLFNACAKPEKKEARRGR